MPASTALYASRLRMELALRNREYAKRYPHVESYGSVPVVVYFPSAEGATHGNFTPEAYDAICSRSEWARRFEKVHTQAATSLPKSERRWRELDSAMSSDALLMNVFCYPRVAEDATVARMLGLENVALPEFGFKARVPLTNGHADRTEVDMKLGSLLVEAKLTEFDFQRRPVEAVQGYRDFAEVFDPRALPQTDDSYECYQLIRNVLAAHALHCSFCVLLDERRPDLREQWFSVMYAVRLSELRTRCKVLTWQELAAVLPGPLQDFLDVKYGIVAPGREASPVPSWQPEFNEG